MDLRLRLILLSLVALVAVAVWSFPAWRGSFQPPSLRGGFPGLEIDLQDDYLALPSDQREELLEEHGKDPAKALEMARVAISAPELAPRDADWGNPQTDAIALASGEFIQLNALHWGAGDATIYQWADGRRSLQLMNFESARGGDMRIYLSRDFQPLEPAQIGADFLDLGRLKGNIGDQSYLLPAGHNLTVYNSAVIYCRQFDEVITVATLR
ncbi:MAG: DM13 domain-containing protein [Chloroflexi bacterium]|nr:DM13 domain-containing protein [Chloroflexota bacterium]MCY3583107.1 DM13 domain-containing protein [Chloroflexota bacterium]MCY3715111.1 DM13 domain-containing protein [Chloroflexota bacterium]MDE2651063.1 DM13 domain-containing protein [Chloroflexota bacterium]MXV92894.1 DM13 domain-containing protein [Chloroflexota bacterium]